MTTLSVCLIAKNEAANIERCLNSVRPYADEIVLVDTGSSDATPELAASLGARVIRTEWINDFSAARNLSLSQATGDWILFLDCDEELPPDSGEVLARLLGEPKHEGYFVTVENLTDKGNELNFPSVRLFRNRSCFRFQGRIHEQIVPSILANYGQDCLGQSQVVVVHHGYHPQTTNIRAKTRRNLEILLTYGEEERDGFFHYNLGTEYWRMGEREKALESYLHALESVNPAIYFGPILVRRTATILMELNRYRTAIEKLRHYQPRLKDFSDLVFLEGACHLACGRYSRAAALFKRYLKMPPVPRHYPQEKGFHGFSAGTMLDWARDQARKGEVPDLAVIIAGGGCKEILPRCIRGIQEAARELVYLDAGSRQGSGELAFEMGASTMPVQTGQSLDAAAAQACGRVQAKWILLLNEDEVLAPAAREGLLRLVRNSGRTAYRLRVRTLLGPSGDDCHLHGELRLFHRKGAHQEGQPADITIDRLRYTRPGKDQVFAGDSAYRQGVDRFYRNDFPAAAECLATLTEEREPARFFFCGLSLINTGQFTTALEVLDEGVRQHADYTDLKYLKGITHFQLGDGAAAEREFLTCLELGDAPWPNYTVNPGSGTHRPLCSLGAILAARGDVPGAMELFLRATDIPGGFEPAMERLSFLVDEWPLEPLAFLESHNLLNSVSLGILAAAMSGKGRHREGLEYLSLAGRRLAEEPAPRNVAVWQKAMEHFLTSLAWKAGVEEILA